MPFRAVKSFRKRLIDSRRVELRSMSSDQKSSEQDRSKFESASHHRPPQQFQAFTSGKHLRLQGLDQAKCSLGIRDLN